MSECCSKDPSNKLNVVKAGVAKTEKAETLEADFSPWEGLGRAAIAINGMWCTSCAVAVETALKKQVGVRTAGVSFASESARIEWDPEQTSLTKVLQVVTELGYAPNPIAQVDRRYHHIKKEIADLRKRIFVSAPLALWVLLAGWSSVEGQATVGAMSLSMAMAAIAVFVYGGRLFITMGWRTLKVGVPGMDFLISLGAGSALLLSLVNMFRESSELYFDAAVFLILFLLIGRLIEHLARRTSANVLHALLAESPTRATLVKEDSSEIRVAVEDLSLDAKVRVRAGERIPVDGLVESGAAHIDKSLLTGESAAELVEIGNHVFAGSINLDGDVFVRSTVVLGKRRIDAISERMEALLAEQSSYEAVAAIVARYLAPGVVLFALIAFIYGWLALGDAGEGVLRAIAVVVVTCPCALGLATPLALLVSSNRAAALGLSFRDGETLEQLARVDAVLFDKTGTLTKGQLRLCEARVASGIGEQDLRFAAAVAEAGSAHPIAKAVIQGVDLSTLPPGTNQTFPGLGVEWKADDGSQELLVGSLSFLQSREVDISESSKSDKTEVHIARDGQWIGSLLLDDELREDAADTVRVLRWMGLKVMMLTGDVKGSALRVAEATGIAENEVHFELSPEQKADLISKTRKQGYRVAFVGEGLNDGPALAAANVGIAAQGSCDLALRSAPLVIQYGGLGRVVDALQLSRRTLSIMRQTIGFALVYNIVAIPAAALGFLRPLIAGAAMVASSLSVTFNSLRIRAVTAGGRSPEQKA